MKSITSLRADVNARWIVVAVAIPLFFIFWLHGQVTNIFPIILAVLFTILYNLVYAFLLKFRIIHPLMDYADIVLDILVITVAVFYTGGSGSIFYWFYLFNIIAEGFDLNYRGIYFALVFALICFGMLLFLEAGSHFSLKFLVSALEQLGVIFLMGAVTLFYTRKAIERERQLEESRAQLAVFLEEMRERVEELSMLYETSKAISSSLSIEGILRDTLNILPAKATLTIALLDPESREVFVYASEGPHAAIARNLRLKMEIFPKEIMRRIMVQQTPIVMRRFEELPEVLQNIIKPEELGAFTVIPLVFQNKVMGVFCLTFIGGPPPTEREIKVFTIVGSHITAAVNNIRAYEAEKKAVAEMKELDKLKDEFISMVSHEIRTPLTSIKAFAEILMNNENIAEDKRKKYFSIINSESERLARLINDMLDVAKIESGEVALNRAHFSVSEMIEEIVLGRRSISDQRSQTVKMTLPLLELLIYADRDRLLEVLENLLSNAIKYTPVGGVIEVGAEEAVDEVRFWVKDNGMGIAPENQAIIFEKFKQLRGEQGGKIKGTGLGLHITRRIVKEHGGKIWVESEVGKGATFYFTVPKRKGIVA